MIRQRTTTINVKKIACRSVKNYIYIIRFEELPGLKIRESRKESNNKKRIYKFCGNSLRVRDSPFGRRCTFARTGPRATPAAWSQRRRRRQSGEEKMLKRVIYNRNFPVKLIQSYQWSDAHILSWRRRSPANDTISHILTFKTNTFSNSQYTWMIRSSSRPPTRRRAAGSRPRSLCRGGGPRQNTWWWGRLEWKEIC